MKSARSPLNPDPSRIASKNSSVVIFPDSYSTWIDELTSLDTVQIDLLIGHGAVGFRRLVVLNYLVVAEVAELGQVEDGLLRRNLVLVAVEDLDDSLRPALTCVRACARA